MAFCANRASLCLRYNYTMANADAPALPLTKLEDVKYFNTDVSPEDFKEFLTTLPQAISGSGELQKGVKVFVPGNERVNSRKLTPADDPDLVLEEHSAEALYYSDIVRLISDSMRWLMENGTHKVIEDLRNQFDYLNRNPNGLLTKWGGAKADGESAVSEIEIQKFRGDIPELINYVLYFAEKEFGDLAAEPSEDVGEAIAPGESAKGDDQAVVGEKPEVGGEVDQAGSAEPDEQRPQPLSPEQEEAHKKKVLYEATWIYNQALHDFFVSHGIDYDYLETHPELRDLILSETVKLLENRSESELMILFANPGRRLEILRELYINLAQSPQFSTGLQNFYDTYTQALPDETRQEFLTSLSRSENVLSQAIQDKMVSSDYQLRQQVAEVLGTDSPTLIGVGSPEFTQVMGSIQINIDALLLGQGADFLVVNSDASVEQTGGNPYNAIWLIQKMSDEHLLLMLGIPPDIRLSEEAVERLRKIVINYARMRAIYLAESAENLTITEGINPLSEADANAIAANDAVTAKRALLAPHQDTAGLIKAEEGSGDGAEVVYGALTKNVKQLEAKRQAQWHSLSKEEQELVLVFLGKEIGAEYYEVPFEIGLFRLQALIAEAELLKYQAASQAMMNEALYAFAHEQELAVRQEFLRQEIFREYVASVNEAEMAAMAEELGYENEAQLSEESLTNVVRAHEGVGARTEAGAAGGGRFGGLGKIGNRFKDRFADRLAPKQKLLGAIKKTGAKRLGSAAAQKLGGLIGGPVGAALTKALTGKNRKLVGGALAGAGLLALKGLAAMLQGGKALLIGLGAGGATGGALLLLGLTGPVGAVIIGVGAGLAAAGGYSLLSGAGGAEGAAGLGGGGLAGGPGGVPPATYATPTTMPAEAVSGAEAVTGGAAAAATTTTTATATGAASWTTVASLPTAVLIPILSLALTAVASLIVILIIQGSFLITLPPSLTSRTYSSNLSGFEGCWPTTGRITSYQTYMIGGGSTAHATVGAGKYLHGYEGPGIALDIGAGGNTAAEGGGNPPVFSPFSGVATFYPEGTGVYCGDCKEKYPYGNYVVVDTGDFALIFAHLLHFPDSNVQYPIADTNQMTSISWTQKTENVQITAGNLLGLMNSTGNSTGNHLHYEVVGGGVDIIDLVPLTDAEKAAAKADEYTIFGMRVSSQECSRSNVDEEAGISGYIAIGPQNPDNLVVTPSSMFQSPVHPCTWFSQNQNLAVAINANYYNSPSEPIGPAGSNPVRYLANANGNDRPPTYMGETMRYLGITTGGALQFGPVPPAWYNNPNMPFNIDSLTKAITGTLSTHPDDNQFRNRVALGFGNVNGQCTDYSGPAFIIGGMRAASYSDLAEMMTTCGAEEFIFLDGGNSASFCSASLNITGSRAMPVSVGLINAEVEAYSSESDQESVGIEPPPGGFPGPQPI